MKKATIFWCTGMSGVGKSTLASYASDKLKKNGLQVYILGGDVVRANYDIQLGFGQKDVEKNNLNIARLCEIERGNYDIIIVPIIKFNPRSSLKKYIPTKNANGIDKYWKGAKIIAGAKDLLKANKNC